MPSLLSLIARAGVPERYRTLVAWARLNCGAALTLFPVDHAGRLI